ncbi:hypothetical protein [Xenorhabdus bovienii]|uniref:Uncharacterized protein n=1 Tax=Xenorhabdus bovienii TaxID=40576 RepID=A0A0B6XC87_XENBV|nr:hypothetical protein [Xenorhabdus bovienii]CDM91472.1 protein of unknown function [Xenorhabdus bovienii]
MDVSKYPEKWQERFKFFEQYSSPASKEFKVGIKTYRKKTNSDKYKLACLYLWNFLFLSYRIMEKRFELIHFFHFISYRRYINI